MRYQVFGLLILILCLVLPAVVKGALPPPLQRTISVGIELDFPPYDFVDEDGKPTGYTADLIEAVARHSNLKLEYKIAPWPELRQALAEGKIDVLPFIARSADRARSMNFTDTHIVGYDAIFVKEGGAPIESEEDLKGRRIIAQSGDLATEYLESRPDIGSVLKVDTIYEAFARLNTGEADAAVCLQVVGLLAIRNFGFHKIRMANVPLINAYTREFAMGVRKDDPLLVNRLNEGLKAVIATGEYGMIYEKWFSELDPAVRRQKQMQRTLAIGLLIASLAATASIATVLIFRRELRRKTRSLAESEARYKGLIAGMPGAVIRISRDNPWKLDYISDTIEEITGYPASDFINFKVRKLSSIVHPDDLPSLFKAIEEAINGTQPYENDFRIVARDGSVHWIHARGTAYPGEDGSVAGIIGIMLDVTEQKRVSELLTAQQSKMAASARLSSLGEMAGGIAHEINNPLAIINLRTHQLSQLAQKGEVKPEEARAIAAAIEATSLRISKIVRSLQAVARDSKDDPFEEVSLKSIIEETFELCYQRLRKHGIEVHLDEIPDDLKITCRRVQISQVLINLLNNAFDAVVNVPERYVRLGVLDRGDRVEISVCDSGPGIPKELAQKIFQPFFTTKEVGKGTGLGLSISKGLIESHGGDLWLDLDSPVTCFVISLPKVPKAPAATRQRDTETVH